MASKGRKSNRFLLISFQYKMTIAPVILLTSVLISVSYVIYSFHGAHVILKSRVRKGLKGLHRIVQWLDVFLQFVEVAFRVRRTWT